MAIINMAAVPVNGALMPSSITTDLDVSNWVFSTVFTPGRDIGQFTLVNPPQGVSRLDFQGNFGPVAPNVYTGTVDAIQYQAAFMGASLPQFTISGFSVPVMDFLAGRADILELVLAGNDIAYGSDAANTIETGGGNDTIHGYAGNDTLAGQAGNDIVYGGAGSDRISGGLGNDWLYGQDGDDQIHGDAGADWLYGGNGNDLVEGGADADVLSGGAGNDTLRGGAGADRILGDLGADNIMGGDTLSVDTELDMVDYRGSTAAVTVDLLAGTGKGGFAEGDTLSGIEGVYGSKFADTIFGTQNRDWLYGQDGGDALYGLLGNDEMYGGNGADFMFGGNGNDRMFGQEGNDYLTGDADHDQLWGGDGDDVLEGGEGNDVLWGDAGNDIMDGGAGIDYLVLGAGNDTLILGAGRDLVRFDYGNGNDTINDFKPGEDRIDFTWTDMTAAAAQANSVQTNAGVLMQLGSGSILLAGVQLGAIDWAGDFLYA